MSERRPGVLPGVLLGLTVAAEAGAVVLSWGLEPAYDTVLYAVFSVTMVTAGVLIVRVHPRHPVGWLLIGFGLLNAVTSDLAQGWGFVAEAHHLKGGAIAEWIAMTSWLPSGLGLTLTFLVFPNGRLPSRSWRWVVWAAPPRLRACAARLGPEPRARP